MTTRDFDLLHDAALMINKVLLTATWSWMPGLNLHLGVQSLSLTLHTVCDLQPQENLKLDIKLKIRFTVFLLNVKYVLNQ